MPTEYNVCGEFSKLAVDKQIDWNSFERNQMTNPFSRTASLPELRWRRRIKSVYGELQDVQSKLAFDKQID